MSSIALTGAATGTAVFTIESPATNTNRTLTLPDATGTVNTSGKANEVPAGSASTPAVYPTGDANTGVFFPDADTVAVATGGSERARITSGGNLLVGGTATAVYFDGKLCVTGRSHFQFTDVNDRNYIWNTATSGNNYFESFGTEGTYTERGSITYNRGAGLVAYNTTSDYRAKDILGPVANPGAMIDALKVYTGKMKGATQERPMLVAHEAQAVAPYSVTGEKDEVNEDGIPKFQQMDVSSLVPLLIAEIQSLRARVAALEAQP